MFVGLTNTPRDYAWGSTTAIADLLGRKPSGGPEAEYWLGTHQGSPSKLVGGPSGKATLAEITTLPFIMKVLAAQTPVSLQAHPSPLQAEQGFARENELGVALDAPNRNYKDPFHKPELVYAISDRFEALCGFRPVAQTRQILARLGADPLVDSLLERLVDDTSLPATFEWLVGGGDQIAALLTRVLELAASADGIEFETVIGLARSYPGDPGILVSLLLNRVTVRRGEAVYLPAGNIHSYLHGLGIEVLAGSDNVLRGGLTPKHVDVPELLKVLDFRPLPVPFLQPEMPVPGLTLFRPDVPDFELAVITPTDAPDASVEYAAQSDFVALCTGGSLRLRSVAGEVLLARGGAAFVTMEDSPVTITGEGTLFIAGANSAPPRG